MIHPRFFFHPQPEALRANLRRFYVFPALKAGWLAERDPEAPRRHRSLREAVRRIARDRYLASLWSALARAEVTVTEDEARAYYRDHPGEFVVPGRISFLMAILDHAGDAAVDRALQALARRARRGGGSVDDKEVHDGFTIVLVEALGRQQDPRLYDALAAVEPGVPHGPVTPGPGRPPIMAWITEAVPNRRRAYDSVRELCVQRLEAARLAELEAEVAEHEAGHADLEAGHAEREVGPAEPEAGLAEDPSAERGMSRLG